MPNDWRTGPRVEQIEYRLLNPITYQPMGLLSGVQSCSLSGSIYSDVRWGGTLNWSGTSQPDWSQLLIHPWYVVDGVGAWPLCPPMFANSPDTEISSTVPESCTVTLYDLTYKLAKRLLLVNPLIIPAGDVLTNTLAGRLMGANVRFSLTPSTGVVATAMNYDTGDSEMKVYNGLLGALGYWSTFADNYGAIQGIPWVDPAQRAPVWHFAPGEASILRPERKITKDDFDVPNVITGIPRTAEGVTPTPVTVFLDTIAPDSPYTFAKRGFWVTAEPLRDVDAADTGSLIARLSQALLDAVPTSTMQVSHAWLPEVGLGSLIDHTSRGKPIKRYIVQKMAIKCELGLTAEAEWREV